MQTTKDELKSILQRRIVKILFKKVDGNERTMVCTLLKDVLPEIKVEEEAKKKAKKSNEKTLTVWDLQKQSYRSFRVDFLINYSVLEEGYEL